MVVSISLYAALIIFAVGLLYKVFRWFRYSISIGAQDVSTPRRLGAAFTGILSTLSLIAGSSKKTSSGGSCTCASMVGLFCSS